MRTKARLMACLPAVTEVEPQPPRRMAATAGPWRGLSPCWSADKGVDLSVNWHIKFLLM